MISRRHLLAAASLPLAASPLSTFAQAKSITFVGWSQDEAASKPTLNALFDDFRKTSGTQLELIGFPWAQMQQNVQLRMRSGQPLDVVQLAERWLPQFGATDKLVDFNKAFGKEHLEALINPGVLALGEYRGKQLGIPWTAGSIGMVGNAKVMNAAGVTSPPRTVDDFVVALRKIKKASPEVVPYAFCTKNNNSMSPDFQVWLWTFGGRIFDINGSVSVNSPAAVRALEFLSGLVKDGLAAKDVDRPDARRMFAQGQTAFYQDAPLARGFARSNSGQGKAFDANVIAVPTPTVKAGDTAKSLAWGHLLTSFGDTSKVTAQSPEAKLIAHLAFNDESQLRYFADVGLFPVTNSALAKLSSDPYVSVWSKSARTASRDETSFWSKSADLTNVIGEEVQAAMLGQKSAQAAAESMAKRLNTKLHGEGA